MSCGSSSIEVTDGDYISCSKDLEVDPTFGKGTEAGCADGGGARVDGSPRLLVSSVGPN